TVKVHVRNIMRRLGVTNRTEAVVRTFERGVNFSVSTVSSVGPQATPA
ncbi:LuxR C-terminal-related transcriptional regulator, partial [Methylobacterium crusticola]